MSSENLDTRTRILNSAWRLLEANVGGDVRMSDIAKEAGISRQAVYLHFPTRGDLLVATTRHLDHVKDVDQRLAASRGATTGRARLDAFIEAWGNYIPEIYGIARALWAAMHADAAAAHAWDDRMEAVRQGCEAAVKALRKDGNLTPGLSVKDATDLLWMLLSVRNWEALTIDRGWSQKKYIDAMKRAAVRMIVAERVGELTVTSSS